MDKIYKLKATVRRTVVDDIDLSVKASSQEDAETQAREVLAVYPDPHDLPNIPHIWISNRLLEGAEVLTLEKV